MLTKKEMKLVEQYARIVSQSFSFPFDWKDGCLYPTRSKVKIFLVTTNFLFSCFYFVFITLRVSKTFGGYTLISMPFHAFAFICNVLYVSFHLHMFIYTDEMSALFNQLKYFNQAQGKRYLDREYHPKNVREKIIQFLHRWINCTACTIAALFVATPNSTHFLYSVVPKYHQTLFVQFGFFVIEAFLAYKVMVFHLFVILTGFFYIVSTNFWIRKVCLEWPEAVPVVTPPEQVESHLQLYRPLTLLNILYNTSFASLVIPVFKTLIELCVVVCAYGTIRLYTRLPLNVWCLLPALASFLFVEHQFAVNRMATIHENSSTMKVNYQRHYITHVMGKMNSLNLMEHTSYVQRFLETSRPLRCQLTHALYVEKSTRLVLLNMLLNMLVTMLLGD